MSRLSVFLFVLACAFSTIAQDRGGSRITQGSLFAQGKNGKDLGACPLKSTSVRAEISGFVARVNVTQEFENQFSEAIEAVYTFPLSNRGAVDDMKMTIGERVIRGKIMKREDARAAYETAKGEGKTASLLDQERPNIFTQSVANIMPGEKVVVEISYVETLKYEDGLYEFVFPMTVGPRFIPNSVNDAAKISPAYVADRPGHDISIEVNVNAGVPIEEIRSTSHLVQQVNFNPAAAKVTLRSGKTIPNKDFILRYDVTGKKLQDGVLAHRSERGGFFSLILQPPDNVASEDRTPKEIVFVLDTSGSMSGFPIEKAKEAMKLSLNGLYPDDTFNFITFAGDTEVLFPQPVPATHMNIGRALEFLETRYGGGGTMMMGAVKAALDASDSQAHLRIVCFMTDGYVGNEDEIIREVQAHPNARVFTFGIGSSVNRHLLDKMAEVGNGEAEYIGLNEDGSKAAKKFYERVRTPLLTNVSIEWSGLPVFDTFPTKLPDLFSARPIIVHGRYSRAATGRARLRGTLAGQEYVREIAVNLPEKEPANSSLASLWARTRIDQLSVEKLRRENAGSSAHYDNQILALALEFRLMTSLTSFVAVEDRVVNYGGVPTKVEVPVAIPEGMAQDSPFRRLEVIANLNRPPSVQFGKGASSGQGQGSGSGNASVVTGSGSSRVVRASSINGLPKSALSIKVDGVDAQDNFLRSSEGFFTFIPSRTDAKDQKPGLFLIESSEPGKRAPLRGRAVKIGELVYPSSAKTSKAEFVLNIEVNPEGFVDVAIPVSGQESLTKAVFDATRLTRFARVFEKGRPIRMAATITYRFNPSTGKADIAMKGMKVIPLTQDDERWIRLGEKLHTSLFDLVARMHQGITEPAPGDELFVDEGMATIRIELLTAETSVANLLAMGFELESVYGKFVKGRIPVAKLAEFGDIPEVKYAAPLY